MDEASGILDGTLSPKLLIAFIMALYVGNTQNTYIILKEMHPRGPTWCTM